MRFELRRGRPLKGEFRLPPDRRQSFSCLLLSLLAPGRTLLRGWQATPEWEHLVRWLRELGASVEIQAEGLVTSPPPDLRVRTEFVLDPFLPQPFAAGFLALAAGFSRSDRPVSAVLPSGAAPGLSSWREALREAGWVARSREEDGTATWTWSGRTPPLREAVCRHTVRRGAWTLAALASGEALEFQESPDLPDPLDDSLPQFGVEIAELREELSPEEEEMRRRMQRLKGREARGPVRRRVPPVAHLSPADLRLSGDVDLAGWCATVACLRRGTDALLCDVAMPASRSGLFAALRRMGADVEVVRRGETRGVPWGDLRLRHGRMLGRKFDATDLPGLPHWACLLAAAAVSAEAETVLSGLSELRGEAGDDLAPLAEGLRAFGVATGLYPDGLVLRGEEQPGAESVDAGGRENVALALHALASSTAGRTVLEGADRLDVVWPHLGRVLCPEEEP